MGRARRRTQEELIMGVLLAFAPLIAFALIEEAVGFGP